MAKDVETARCAECGAPAVEGLDCWEQFGWVLAWESQDPDLLAEHFLTVVSYNLQHPSQFTEDAITWLRSAFIDRLDYGTSVATMRRRMAQVYNGKRRVLARGERLIRPRSWSMTIADVYIPDQLEGAAERVRRWAATVRRELG